MPYSNKMDNVVIVRYYPTFWQKIKIRLFGLKHLSECRKEELTEEELDIEGWYE